MRPPGPARSRAGQDGVAPHEVGGPPGRAAGLRPVAARGSPAPSGGALRARGLRRGAAEFHRAPAGPGGGRDEGRAVLGLRHPLDSGAERLGVSSQGSGRDCVQQPGGGGSAGLLLRGDLQRLAAGLTAGGGLRRAPGGAARALFHARARGGRPRRLRLLRALGDGVDLFHVARAQRPEADVPARELDQRGPLPAPEVGEVGELDGGQRGPRTVHRGGVHAAGQPGGAVRRADALHPPPRGHRRQHLGVGPR
mmetsp:Transcript_66371/g.186963  ORF Transcript_66371/g.186963 Transcript_66371/m.186963 type:complete len:252 (+) Transcript_66371:2170-2925(+)